MANIIKIKRGLKSNLPNSSSTTLGELRYATDTNELFIDTGSENKLINKDYIDTKVSKTNDPIRVYATDTLGNQTTIPYSNTINAGYMVQRDSNAQVIVPEVPVADENAASKKYVDDGLALKPDTTSLDDVAFTGSYNDLVDTPTYKTINSEIITGTGDIPLQTQLSGTDGNIVTYTSTTGTLGELGFDNAPIQNSNKLVKSGSIWTELQKKINYTDIINNLTTTDTNKPLSAYQGKVLDEKITLAQQSTHDRGVVQNALTSQDQNYTITNVTVNNGGTNYTIGDILFLTSDLSFDAIINVTNVDTSGVITGISLGQGGSFTQDLPSIEDDFVGGTGNGAKFNVTTSLVNNSTLASISNPQPNDFATVLHDEIHDNLRYVWKYVDIDGDGNYEWVSGYPITNIERNFYNDPIKDGELDTNAVTTVKIANKNVTEEKIANNAIIARHITAGTITDSHIASGADIDQSKIKNLSATLNNKVSRTAVAYQVYGTAGANLETTISYATTNDASTIVQRDVNSQINVALTPTANTNATSKKYVNDQDELKVDKVSGSKRVYGTDSSGNQTTYDYDSFGKVDDVKVGNTSVVVNKIAALGTMAGEDKNDYILGNNPITAATKTKITYDSKGLVTNGEDLIESDIPSLHLSKISDVTVTPTEVNYLSGVTSNVQTQLNDKVAKTSGISKVYGTDNTGAQTLYDFNSFSHVDDVKVGTTSVVDSNKVANLGTMAGESKDDYVDLTSNQTITGTKKFTSDSTHYYTVVKDSSVEYTVAPNTNHYRGIRFEDKNNDESGFVRLNFGSDGTNVYEMGVRGEDGTYNIMYLGRTSTGTSYLNIPQPTANNTTSNQADTVGARNTALLNKVTKNADITGATKCKITYDSKGLVTAGADLADTDIPSIPLSKINDVIATYDEVNYLSGVTSSVQNQINDKVTKTSNISKVYGTDSSGNQTTYDYDSFGKVDDVKVGNTSVVTNKIANLGTMAGETAANYYTKVNADGTFIKVNPTITGSTKTKITYDSKGLVTAGDNLSESDIPSIHLSKISDVTATTAEVNVLDGITASTTELNYVDGVTSNIQTQLDNKVTKNTAITAGTKTKITYDSKGLVTAGDNLSSSDIPSIPLSKISDVTATATEVNYLTNTTSNIQTQINTVTGKIPSEATTSNQLADKAFVNSSIANMAANYITSDAQGDNFPTKAALIAGPYYYKGQLYTPTNNDYALVEDDETKNDATTRYIYDGVQWAFQYIVNDTPFTQAQLNAINSTITSNLVARYSDHIVNTDIHVTNTDKTNWNAKADDNSVVHKTGNETINGTKTFNDTLELKNNLSFRSYGSNDSGRLQFRAQPSDNIIRGTVAITDGYSTSGSGYNGFVAQMVARSGSTASEPFNTMRVSNKGIEYIKEANDGTITGQYIVVDNNGLVPSDRLATSGSTGQVLTKTSSGQSWQTVNALPSQTGQSGKYLTTNGTTASWVAIEEYTANEVETLWNSI